MAKVAGRDNIDVRVRMVYLAMLEEILFATVSSPSSSITPFNTTGESGLIVFLAHVLFICGLRSERLLLPLNAAWQTLEGQSPIMRTSLMGAYREGILKSRARIQTIHVGISLVVVIVSNMLHQVILPSKAISTLVTFAIFAREFRNASVKRL